MDKLIMTLTEMVTDSSYMNPDPKIFEELDEPILEYTVNDNMTLWTFSSKKDFSDNEMYSTFYKISKKGKESDFVLMTKSKNPSIRVYGFWALLKKDKLIMAEKLLDKEKENSEQVLWNSFGCEVYPRETEYVMQLLLERNEKYGVEQQ